METKFSSQICTSREQSERLLALGLKKETADMRYDCIGRMSDTEMIYREKPIIGPVISYYDIPAWSLHRLIEMADTTTCIEDEQWVCMDKCYCWNNHESFYATNLYDSLINCIEWLINKGYFDKDYLCEK